MSEDALRSERMKAVIDLHEYLESIGSDRPKISAFLKELGIKHETMWDCVVTTAHAASITVPQASIEIVNYLFKLGVTIGYKYAVKKEMERSFPLDSETKE